jgi:hypothetical protein
MSYDNYSVIDCDGHVEDRQAILAGNARRFFNL